MLYSAGLLLSRCRHMSHQSNWRHIYRLTDWVCSLYCFSKLADASQCTFEFETITACRINSNSKLCHFRGQMWTTDYLATLCDSQCRTMDLHSACGGWRRTHSGRKRRDARVLPRPLETMHDLPAQGHWACICTGHDWHGKKLNGGGRRPFGSCQGDRSQ